MSVRILCAGMLFLLQTIGLFAEDISYLRASEVRSHVEKNPHVVVLDVRPKSMYDRWRLKCASCRHINIPIDDMTIPKDFFLEDVAKNNLLEEQKKRKTPFILVCWVGILTAHVSEELKRSGYAHVTLEGGLDALSEDMIEGVKPLRPELPIR